MWILLELWQEHLLGQLAVQQEENRTEIAPWFRHNMSALDRELGRAALVAFRWIRFFLNEGFGSPDDEALSRAMDTLAGLSDGSRLVGIISHVPESKRRIDRHIRVTKRCSDGSAVRFEGV